MVLNSTVIPPVFKSGSTDVVFRLSRIRKHRAAIRNHQVRKSILVHIPGRDRIDPHPRQQVHLRPQTPAHPDCSAHSPHTHRSSPDRAARRRSNPRPPPGRSFAKASSPPADQTSHRSCHTRCRSRSPPLPSDEHDPRSHCHTPKSRRHSHRHPGPSSSPSLAPSPKSAATPGKLATCTVAGETLTCYRRRRGQSSKRPISVPMQQQRLRGRHTHHFIKVPRPAEIPSVPLSAGLPAANARELPRLPSALSKQNRNPLRRVHRNIRHSISIEVRHRKARPPGPSVIDPLQRQTQMLCSSSTLIPAGVVV